jgi:hypothetical protein
MRFIALCSFLLLGLVLAAQPEEMPAFSFVEGDSATYFLGNPEGLAEGPSGKDVVWDFRQLKTSPGMEVVKILQAPDRNGKASFIMKFGDQKMLWFSQNGDSLQLFRERDLVNHVDFDHGIPLTLLPAGLRLGNRLTRQTVRTYPFMGKQRREYGSFQVGVDGSGVLMLPTGSFPQVLRLKHVLTYSDTPDPLKAKYYVKEIRYQWFTQDCPFPLMELNTLILNDPPQSFVRRHLRIIERVPN